MGTSRKQSGKEKAVVPNRAPSFSAPGSKKSSAANPSAPDRRAAWAKQPAPRAGQAPGRRGQGPSPGGQASASRAPSSAAGGQAPSSAPRKRPDADPDASLRRTKAKILRKKRLARLYLALSTFIILLSVIVAGTVFFKVENFVVYGNQHYTAEEIINATGIAYEDNLFLMDKFRIIDKVLSEMIFLESIDIRRVLPDTIRITVTEVQIAGAIESEGAYWLCDKSGRLLEQRTTLPADAPLVVGAALEKPAVSKTLVTKEKEKQQPLLTLLPALAESGLASGVTKISLEKIYELTIWYKGSFEILLGKSDNLPDKCRRLALLLPQLESEGLTSARIDASGPAIHVLP